jgi:type I restriction enzyme, S subunit
MKEKYNSYKSTIIPWLPEIPVHWEVRKAKYLFRERNERGRPDEPLLAATQTKGVVRKEEYETRTVTAQKDLHLLKLVKKKDFVISLRSFQGGIEFAYHQGIISPAYTVFFEKDDHIIDKDYFKYLFKSAPFIASLSLFVTGIREGQNIDYSEFKNSLLPLPSKSEQRLIADFLNHKSELVHRFIAKKLNLIDVLKQKKKALLHETLNERSAQGRLIKLKYCVRNVSLQSSQKETDEVYVGMENIESWTGRFVEAEKKDFESQAKKFDNNDVLFGKLRPYLAKVYRAQWKGVCSSEFIVLRSAKLLMPEFLKLVLLDPVFINEVNSSTFGAKMPRADWDFIGNVKISVPDRKAQAKIIEFIETEGSRIDGIIKRIELEISKVKELRQSLVADTVTGQLRSLDLTASK